MGLMDYTAVELGKKIKAGEVSVLEAANAAMDAIDALEDKFNCYVTVQERAAVQAKAEELQKKIDDGTLTGLLPVYQLQSKDNMCTKWGPVQLVVLRFLRILSQLIQQKQFES